MLWEHREGPLMQPKGRGVFRGQGTCVAEDFPKEGWRHVGYVG